MKIRNHRKWMSLVMSAVLLTGMFPGQLQAQESGETISWEAASDEAEPETSAPKEAEPEPPAPKPAEPEPPAPKEAEPEPPAPKPAEPEPPAPEAPKPETPAAEPSSQPDVNAAPEDSGNAAETVPETAADMEISPETADETDAAADMETASEVAAEVPDGSSEEVPEAEKEPASERLTEGGTETASEEAGVSFEGEGGSGKDGEGETGGKEEKDGKGKDGKRDEDEEDSSPCLSGVSVGEDFDGAYLYYVFKRKDKPAVITVSITDGSGNTVGSSTSASVTGDRTEMTYLLPLSGSPYGLSLPDLGKAVHASVTAESEGKSETVVSESSVTLRAPSQIMPAFISCTAASVFGDLMNPETISGSVFDPGSFGTSRSVEKMTGGGWEAKDPGAALTAADGGTYRIRIVTCLGDFYSNEFKVIVPATGITVEGEQRIGGTLSVKPQGENGSVPEVDAYEWFFKEGSPVSNTAVYTADLKDTVDAQSLTLHVRITDQLGNKYTQVIMLAPLDLAAVSLTLSGYEELTYSGNSQTPMDGRILLGDYVIPRSLYATGPASGRNTINAGPAWMTVTGNSAYLSGASDVEYVIGKEEPDVDEDDFITSFTYDGKTHQPVLGKTAGTEAKLKYKHWQKKEANGSWTDISGAPADGGTYRVTVTIRPADGNYKKAVFRKLEFTITGGPDPEPETEPAPKAAPADLTVTDAAGIPAGYRSKTILAAAGDGQEAQRVMEISADPVKLPDGNVKTDVSGKAVYGQRNLHITPAFVKGMQSRQETMVRFILGEAGIQFPVSVLQAGTAYTVKLAPLGETDLTDGEKHVLAGYETISGVYALCICRENDGMDVTEQIAPEVMLEVKPEDTDEPADILFLMEDRGSAQTEPVPDSAGGQAVRQEDKVYLKRTVSGSGIFGLLR